METFIIELQNGDTLEVYELSSKSGANTGDIIYDFSEEKFHPVYMLGNTNMCFEDTFQAKIHKVIKSSVTKHGLPF